MEPAEASDKTLLVVEDDPGLRKQLKWCFDKYAVVTAEDREAALAAVRRHEPQVVLQDLGLPPDAEGVTEGMETLREILAIAPETKVIVVTGNGDRENAVRSVALGAYDFYQKPVDVEVLKLLVDRAFALKELEEENQRLTANLATSPMTGIIAASPPMLKVCRMIERIASADVTTLLLGESGTGKEVLARALHNLSARKDGRFVAINCAAIPENLLESELFGYEKGAFTGAHKQTKGKVELADGGTLMLDEIGDMQAQLQSKLLRFLQERVVERIGGRQEIPVDVRVVCATNQDLEKLIAEGKFREDLYYRVAEIAIRIPPLRDREGDQILLARFLLDRFSNELGRKMRGFSEDAQQAIQNYEWPGNVREMENRIKGAVVTADQPVVSAEDLGLDDFSGAQLEVITLKTARELAERDALGRALAVADGNVSRVASLLGVTRPTVYDLMGKYDLKADA
jgi:two-component system NtrC family response regulator